MIRKSVNFSDEEADYLFPLLDEEQARVELASAVGEEAARYSDSGAIRALTLLGAMTLRNRLLEKGYAELAATYSEDDRAAAEVSVALAAEAWHE
ncbi:MAG: hypothetical protein ABR548_09875 [Actinomycetota bacterium]|nr:hypothetical protein [Actinomycetota bacterium]